MGASAGPARDGGHLRRFHLRPRLPLTKLPPRGAVSAGEAAKGVKLNVNPTKEAIAAARDYNRDYDWLVQKMITWGRVDGHAAYIRGYNVLGHRALLWWALEHQSYGQLTWEDLYRHDLMP